MLDHRADERVQLLRPSRPQEDERHGAVHHLEQNVDEHKRENDALPEAPHGSPR